MCFYCVKTAAVFAKHQVFYLLQHVSKVDLYSNRFCETVSFQNLSFPSFLNSSFVADYLKPRTPYPRYIFGKNNQ